MALFSDRPSPSPTSLSSEQLAVLTAAPAGGTPAGQAHVGKTGQHRSSSPAPRGGRAGWALGKQSLGETGHPAGQGGGEGGRGRRACRPHTCPSLCLGGWDRDGLAWRRQEAQGGHGDTAPGSPSLQWVVSWLLGRAGWGGGGTWEAAVPLLSRPSVKASLGAEAGAQSLPHPDPPLGTEHLTDYIANESVHLGLPEINLSSTGGPLHTLPLQGA